MDLKTRLAQYAPIKLTADFTHLSDNDRHILPLLFEAAQAMDEPFWVQNYGKQQKLLAQTADPDLQRLLKLNYGPWDKMQFNTGVAMDEVERGNVNNGSRTVNRSWFGNVVYAVNKQTDVAFELSHWNTEYKGSGDAESIRAQLALMYKF